MDLRWLQCWPRGPALAWAIAAASTAGALPVAAAVPIGSELRVNSYTTGDQFLPAVGIAADGDFVVVWSSFGQDGAMGGIFARLFSSSGAAAGAEIQVNTYTAGAQRLPGVAMDPAGDFVVVWDSDHDGSGSGVFAQRFSSAGEALGGELQVNAHFLGNQYDPSVAVESDGDFVVVWSSENQDGFESGIFGQRFSSAGEDAGGEFLVNAHTIGIQQDGVVAVDADGDFVVAWRGGYDQEGDEYGIFGQRFSSAGTALGVGFQVNSYTVGSQYWPRIAIGAAGDFVIVWESEAQDGSLNSIFGQRFASSGAPLGAEFMVNTYTPGTQQSAALVVDGDGDFVVAWEGVAFGSQYHIFARRFASTGAGVGAEFQVSTTVYPTDPAAAMSAGGALVVVWKNQLSDPGATADIFVRRVAESVPDPLDVDADGELQALTDGLLILRYLFGLRDAVLVGGVVDIANCARCTPAQIEVHLAAILAQLDVDGDGQVEALTDGLLILRYLFGLRSGVLVGGAVDLVSCTRCLAPEIEAFLESLTA
jgi:hypothetical protein